MPYFSVAQLQELRALHDPFLAQVGDQIFTSNDNTTYVVRVIPGCLRGSMCKIFDEPCVGILSSDGYELCLSSRYSNGLVAVITRLDTVEGGW